MLSLGLFSKLRLSESGCELRHLSSPCLISNHLSPLVFLCLSSLLCFELVDFGFVMFVGRVQFHVDVQVLFVEGILHLLNCSVKFSLRYLVSLDSALHAVNSVVGFLQVDVCRCVCISQRTHVFSFNLLLLHLFLRQNCLSFSN